MHRDLIRVIHDSKKKGGCGLIAEPGYWVGVPASLDYIDGQVLFLIYQELYLLAHLREINPSAHENFLAWLAEQKILTSYRLFVWLRHWSRNSYARVPPRLPDVVTAEQAFLGAITPKTPLEQQQNATDKAIMDFYQLMSKHSLWP